MTPAHLLSLAPLVLGLQAPPAAVAADPVDLETAVEEVTVFPGQALVRRVATAPASGGSFAIRGLPWGLDPNTVRVRCEGGDVVGIETRERVQGEAPDARVQALRDRLRDLGRERTALTDERSLADDVKNHLQRLLALEPRPRPVESEGEGPGPEAWAGYLAYVTERLAATRATLREVRWQIEEIDARIADVESDLGHAHRGTGVQLRDVLVEVLGHGREPLRLELEYLVSGAGWQPTYDLRAASDARTVELTYRARVWQETGEDWSDVALLLSTARPNLGAQGPDPEPVWLRLILPQRRARGETAAAAPASEALGAEIADEATQPYDDASAGAALRFAVTESQGLSVRFRLHGRETIESRGDPTTVLVGQESLAARPEYFAVPSLDTNVWLRGVTENTSAWTLLPGRAAVFFGADFVGHAEIGLVQPGQELTLHLGADPALTVARQQTEDMTKGPGIFGSREKLSETWVVRLENHGAAAAGPDGAAIVHVREALPRSTDGRIQVELTKAVPAPSADDRWKRDLEEQGVRTWVLRVPRGAETELTYQLKVSYPQGERVVR